jgi:EAL domain-containing protein (putative c-di-GMP-specific phosphodiesterase class I)
VWKGLDESFDAALIFFQAGVSHSPTASSDTAEVEMRRVPQIFLSYVRQDKEKVEELYRRLFSAGFKPWMDKEDVIAGQQWRFTIEKAIHESDFFLACLSEHSVSKRGFLQREIRKALEVWQEKLPDDIYLIPVLLEKCEVPESLADFQWVEIFEQHGWAQLLRAIRLGVYERRELTAPVISIAGLSSLPSTTKNFFSRSEVTTVKNFKPMPAAELPDSMKVANKLPLVTFPDELCRFVERVAPGLWESLDEATQRFIATLGTKLEPIVQVTPRMPVPLVIGFENLALGSLGENFSQICERVPHLEPGLLRLLLSIAALKTTSVLRHNAVEDGHGGVWRLLFTVNLDPEMLDCSGLEKFLEMYERHRDKNVLFEVNERTTSRYLRRLKELQVDFNLRYCADDFNDWEPEVKKELKDRVEMSKVDYKTFRKAMDMRGDSPEEAIRCIAAHRISGKPLIVEGVESFNYLRFLHERWPSNKYGHLYGQGYIIEPGQPWDSWTTDLRKFGLPGGHFLTGPYEVVRYAH